MTTSSVLLAASLCLFAFVSISISEEWSYRVILPSQLHDASAEVVDTFPENLDEFTVCSWIRPTNWTGRGASRAVFSYSVDDWSNDILISIHHDNVTLSRRGKSVSLQLHNGTFLSGRWRHICTTWSVFQGTVRLFADGSFSGSGNLSPKIPSVPLGGQIVLGKTRHSNQVKGYDCHSCEPWRGDLTEVHVWDTVLCEDEILGISSCNSTLQGNVLSWSRITIVPKDGAAVKSVHLCELSKCPHYDLD